MTTETRRTHQPKGGMCRTCLMGLTRNCAGLPFELMPVIDVDKDTGVKIVKCTDHTPLPNGLRVGEGGDRTKRD